MEYFISLLLIWKGEHLKSSWLKYLAPLSVLEHMVNENQIYFARIVLSKLFDCKYKVIDFLSVWSKWPIATTANIKTKKKKKKIGNISKQNSRLGCITFSTLHVISRATQVEIEKEALIEKRRV